jgi:uncharacterized protein YndB with AHSA1/START domain
MSLSSESLREDCESERESVTREVVIDAEPHEVWEALVTEEGRERWLEQAALTAGVALVGNR